MELTYFFEGGKSKYNNESVLIDVFEAFRYIKKENGVLKKGEKFNDFKNLVDGFNDKDKMDISMYANYFNSTLIALLFNLIFYYQGIISIILILIVLVIFIISFKNIHFLWSLRDKKDYLNSIINKCN